LALHYQPGVKDFLHDGTLELAGKRPHLLVLPGTSLMKRVLQHFLVDQRESHSPPAEVPLPLDGRWVREGAMGSPGKVEAGKSGLSRG
jgi:hypothetical protein